ncbi:FtsX-like permease family protein [Hutsoniella sourekii]
MKSVVLKDNLREIKRSFPRFISILLIIALGVAFFIGIRAAGPSMIQTARHYYQTYHLPDGVVSHPAGLDSADQDLLQSAEGLDWLFMRNFQARVNPSQELAQVYALPRSLEAENNFFDVREGHLPQNSNEIVLDYKYIDSLNHLLDDPIVLGDEIVLDLSQDQTGDKADWPRGQRRFEVVGFATSPLYFERSDRGLSGATVFAIVDESVAKEMDVSEAYFWDRSADHESFYSDFYNQQLEQIESKLEGLLDDRNQDKRADLTADLQEQIRTGRSEVESGYDNIESAEEQLNQASDQLRDGYRSYQEGLEELEAMVRQSKSIRDQYLEAGMDPSLVMGSSQELHAASQQLHQSYHQLMVNEIRLKDQSQQFNEEKTSHLEDLSQAESDLDQAEQQLSDLESVDFQINLSQDNASYKSVQENADQLVVISNIFPVLFFAIAILVTYSTIYRMVSEQRNYMGTMRQLGFPDSTILSKFILYAGLSACLGIGLGLVTGYLIFPGVIINAYNNLYYFDQAQIVNLPLWNVITALVALSTALIPAISHPLQTLQVAPAQLLRPEPPRSGKKTLIEQIDLIWRRIGFKAKMTIRNLLRYKARNLMTLIGVAGCTMLIVTGFGISDTISDIVPKQFNDIQLYDSVAYVEEGADLREQLEAMDGVRRAVPVASIPYLTQTDPQQTVQLVVPMTDKDDFKWVQSIHQRGDHEEINLAQEGPVVTERLAEHLDLQQAGIRELEASDNKTYAIDLNRISENYLGHYIYLTADQYRDYFGEDPELNAYYINYEDDQNTSELEASITDLDSVYLLANTSTASQTANQAMSSLELITLVLIISAAGLAFIVLYNLTNINIAERIRELSTIKVLGFYDWEVSLYIYNEILVLTILGACLGLIVGTGLNHYIMKTMQINDLLFYPRVDLASYGLSFVITLIFSLVVMILMHFKLKNVDMVEALKAVE